MHEYITVWFFPDSQKNLGYQVFTWAEFFVAFIIILLAPTLFQAVI